jgi:hypothetical protein
VTFFCIFHPCFTSILLLKLLPSPKPACCLPPPPKKSRQAREKVSIMRTTCRCRNSFSDHKCGLVYRHDQLIPHHPPPHPSSIISSQQPIGVRKIWCICAHALVYNLVNPNMTTEPFVLNDVWPKPGSLPVAAHCVFIVARGQSLRLQLVHDKEPSSFLLVARIS